MNEMFDRVLRELRELVRTLATVLRATYLEALARTIDDGKIDAEHRPLLAVVAAKNCVVYAKPEDRHHDQPRPSTNVRVSTSTCSSRTVLDASAVPRQRRAGS